MTESSILSRAGYAAYVLQRVERDRQAATIESKRQNLMRKELAWLRRGAPARTAKPKFRIDAATELIAEEPPVRSTVQLTQLATSRLGRDVLDILDVDAGYGDLTVLRDVTLHIGPADRIGVLGPNGAGKSMPARSITWEVSAAVRTSRARQDRDGPGEASQRLEGLEEHLDSRISDVVARYRTTFRAGKDEVLPRAAAGASGLHHRASEGEGGGPLRRPASIEPAVHVARGAQCAGARRADERHGHRHARGDGGSPGHVARSPIVVSHDRYLLERVTDTQYAVLDGAVRHVPGGVEQYLALRAESTQGAGGSEGVRTAGAGSAGSAIDSPCFIAVGRGLACGAEGARCSRAPGAEAGEAEDFAACRARSA